MIITYTTELLRIALAGDADLGEALHAIADLCIAEDYCPELYDFYLLDNAFTSLRESEV